MLSICIPVYNYDVRPLVKALHRQAKAAALTVEILLLDDASEPSFREKNGTLKSLPDVNYKELKKNIGRSKIRNQLREKASYRFLLFLDCDTEVPDNDFLNRYIPFLHTNKPVLVYGGRSYHPEPKNDTTLLHWHFGRNREVKHAEIRSSDPYKSFMSNNFLIHKTILEKVPFNEQLKGYGHEDTLLGYELKKQAVPLIHIENPMIHAGLETADEFLDKTDEGLKNLLNIIKILNNDKEFIRSIRVLRSYTLLRRYWLRTAFAVMFRTFEKPIRQNLRGKAPRLWLLDLYKLGKLCHYSMRSASGTF